MGITYSGRCSEVSAMAPPVEKHQNPKNKLITCKSDYKEVNQQMLKLLYLLSMISMFKLPEVWPILASYCSSSTNKCAKFRPVKLMVVNIKCFTHSLSPWTPWLKMWDDVSLVGSCCCRWSDCHVLPQAMTKERSRITCTDLTSVKQVTKNIQDVLFTTKDIFKKWIHVW
jgi:hypothetical protein